MRLHKKNDVKVNLRMPDELWQKLKIVAERYNWTTSQVVRKVLEEFVHRSGL